MLVRDRNGEMIDADELHRCDAGWIDRDSDRPRPCVRCRPWLAHRRPPTADELPRRHPRVPRCRR